MSNVESWGNPIGCSGTNMRYVTITGSRFYNNGDRASCRTRWTRRSSRPPRTTSSASNEIFWNNFNFHAGAPFKPKTSGVVPLVPVGTGLLLLGGRRNIVEDNKVFGNYAVGIAAVEGILLEENPQARALVGNIVRDNAFGLDGTDLNGRELAYDGNGTDNCFGGNTGVSVTIPADGSTLAAVPVRRRQRVQRRRQASCSSSPARPRCRKWIKHPHAPKPGFTPLEVYHAVSSAAPCPPPSPPSPRCCARRRRTRATRSARP